MLVDVREENGRFVAYPLPKTLSMRQKQMVRLAVKIQVNKILMDVLEEYPSFARYHEVFEKVLSTRLYKRCYSDAHKAGCLKSPYADTPCECFEDAITFIENWVPAGGVRNFVEEYLNGKKN